VIRTLLAAVLSLFLPARGHRRATHAPAPVRRPTPRAVRPVPAPLIGEDIALIRPYYQRWAEATPAEREALLQRTRRMDAAEVSA